MVEARRSQRHLTLKTGKIRWGDVEVPVECAVLNVSGGGACLLVPDAAAVPDGFLLLIDHVDGSCECSVVWRTKHRIGVAFRDSEQSSAIVTQVLGKS